MTLFWDLHDFINVIIIKEAPMSMYRSSSKPPHDNLRHPIAGSRRIGASSVFILTKWRNKIAPVHCWQIKIASICCSVTLCRMQGIRGNRGNKQVIDLIGSLEYWLTVPCYPHSPMSYGKSSWMPVHWGWAVLTVCGTPSKNLRAVV